MYDPHTRQFEIRYKAGNGIQHDKQHLEIYDYLKVDGDSLKTIANGIIEGKKEVDSIFKATPFSLSKDYIIYTAGAKFMFDYMYHHAILSPADFFEEIAEKFLHIIPKMFFVLMPLFALLLFSVFFNKRDYYFVDHAVLSLHVHTILFISLMLAFLLSYIYIPDLVYTLLFFGALLPGIYFLASAKAFYQRSWLFTLIAGSIIWLVYMALVFIISIATLFFVAAYL